MPILSGGTLLNNGAYDVLRYSVTPALGTSAAVLAATTLGTGVTTTVSTGFGTISVPRNVTITGNAAGINGNVVVNGYNYEGKAISETLTANGTTLVAGSKAFSSVSSIVFPARNTAGDTIAVGLGAKLGLPSRLDTDTLVFANLNGVREATRPTVAVNGSNVESNTVTLNSALNGTKVDIFYVAL